LTAAPVIDTGRTVTKVEFFRAGTTLIGTSTAAPYTVNWTSVAAGSYSLTTKLTDSTGATSTSSATAISVVNNTAPTVTMTATPAAATAPATVALKATATDADGTVAKVEFFNGTTLLATKTATPYDYSWANVAAGTYSVTAKATDNLGSATTTAATAATAVTVTTAAPAAAKVYYIQSDQLNTPRTISNAAGQTVWQWDQAEAFGSNLPNENPTNLGTFAYNPRFPEQYFDKETGLHYNYFRDYDPQTGRYVQSDPIGLRGGINTYAYVKGNPISYVDPNGLICLSLDKFRDDFLENFVTVQDSTSLLKTVAGLGLGGAFASRYGGLTLLGAAGQALAEYRKGMEITGLAGRTFSQAAATAAGTWAINGVLIKSSFDAGVLVGSILRAATLQMTSSDCDCKN